LHPGLAGSGLATAIPLGRRPECIDTGRMRGPGGNRFRCPLTDVAARYTEERAANFDIYLPEWLARHNQSLFGVLFVAGGLFTLWRWLVARR